MRVNLGLLLLLAISLWACKEEAKTPAENAPIEPKQGISLTNSMAANERKEVVIPEGYQQINWGDLADVKFEPRYFEQAKDSLLFPTFGPAVKVFEGEKVAISGFVIPVTYDRYVLSAYPFSQCFFCGNAGPESVMELKIADLENVLFHTDEFRTFVGDFKLNDSNIDQLNYILDGASAL
ncbi:MAG: DUF3299 domain-containing protein [Bacteroidota bacterium]